MGNLQTAWVSYCCWNDQENLPPLRAIFDRELSRSLSARFASYRTFMEAIVQKAVEQNVWQEPTDSSVAKEILRNVDLSGIIPTKTPKGHPRRLEQLRWTTLVNDFYAMRQQSQQTSSQSIHPQHMDDGDSPIVDEDAETDIMD